LCYNTVFDEYQERNLSSFYHDGNNVDKKEELDGLCDIQVVLSGSILALGYQDVFNEAFEEVHSSNMSKLCNSEQELENTIKYYTNREISVYSHKKGDKWIVMRKEDNKILKNLYYKEANLKKFIK
jgi:hypothetical protein